RVLVVVGCTNAKPSDGGGGRHEPRAAAELQQRPPVPALLDDECRQYSGRWPDVRPIWQPLVALEVRLVDKVLGALGVQQRECTAPNRECRGNGPESARQFPLERAQWLPFAFHSIALVVTAARSPNGMARSTVPAGIGPRPKWSNGTINSASARAMELKSPEPWGPVSRART